MKLKKFAVFALAFLMFFSLMPVSARAASTVTYNSFDDIKEDWEIFKTISSGKISAVNENNTWYYQFTRSGYATIRINISAFTSSSPQNGKLNEDITALNASLTKLTTQNYSRICYYFTIKSQQMTNYTSYTISMYRFKLIAGGADSEFLVRCELEAKSKYPSCVAFTFNTKIRPDGLSGFKTPESRDLAEYLIEPYSASSYLAALTRSDYVDKITPKMTVKVVNTGINSINLSRYTVSGIGSVLPSTKGLIDIVFSLVDLGVSVFTKDYYSALKNLSDIDMSKLTKQSNVYNTGNMILLSENKKFVYEAVFKSPIKLSSRGDKTQVNILCNADIGSAIFNVSFSFS